MIGFVEKVFLQARILKTINNKYQDCQFQVWLLYFSVKIHLQIKVLHLGLFHSYLQLIFEGIRGPGIEGDIAIDDVSIAEGECAKQDLTTKSKCLFLDLLV